MDWATIVAQFINTTLVLLIVQGVKLAMPVLRARAPYVLPLLAAVIGPLVALGETWLSAKLGQPVILSPIVAVLTGLAATGVNQFIKTATPPTSRLHAMLG